VHGGTVINESAKETPTAVIILGRTPEVSSDAEIIVSINASGIGRKACSIV
jgi:hypothetical protein